ncbi:hypothetical protein BGW38_005034, partial [Lunasporangiospora selenospora]
MATSFTHKVGTPIYCVGFTDDNNLILAGGGGAGRSGVKNKISIFKIDGQNKTLTPIVEKELSRDEDAPMSMAIHPKEQALAFGINSSENKIKAGENENCRIFQYSSEMIESVHNKKTLTSVNPDDYQKVVRFSRDGTLLATGGTDGVIALLKYPGLTPAIPMTQFKGHEILDIDFSSDGAHIAAVSSQNLWIISTEKGAVVEAITNPVLNQKKACQFRFCRFGRGAFNNVLYTIVNGTASQKPFVCMWDATNWTRLRTLTVGSKPIMTCAVSPDGKLIAFSSSDLSVRICSSKTLKVLMTVPKVHVFVITSLAFNSDSTLLVTGSIDTTSTVITVPKTFPK